MCYLLNGIYLALLFAVSPYLFIQSWRTGKYRQGWPEKFGGFVPQRKSQNRCLWFHAVSVGEVLQLKPIVTRWRQAYPDWDLVISTTTNTGRDVAEKQYPDCLVCYCPLDFSWAVQRAIKRLRPDCLVLVELELWPNLIRLAHQSRVPVVVVNGRLSEKSFRGYSKIGWLIRPLLGRLKKIAVQNEEYAERFLKLGASSDQIEITGSIKFDNLSADRESPAIIRIRQQWQLPSGQQVLLAGSTHAPEEELILQAWQKLRTRFPDWKLMIAPRHAERFQEVAEIISAHGFPVSRRSQSTQLPTSTETPESVFLLDTLGELSACWGLAEIAYVGGSLNQRGGQNMLEPAAFGTAVLFGPNTWNFAEVVAGLKSQLGCREVATAQDLPGHLEQLLASATLRGEIGARAQHYVLSLQGGVPRTIRLLEEILSIESSASLRLAG